jgi:hypothetical protein
LSVDEQLTGVERLRDGIGGDLLRVALPSELDEETRALVERLVEMAERLSIRCAQLQHALDSRIVIEQAKGVLAMRLQTTPDQAFAVLRHVARSNRCPIHDVARQVVETRDLPPPFARGGADAITLFAGRS